MKKNTTTTQIKQALNLFSVKALPEAEKKDAEDKADAAIAELWG